MDEAMENEGNQDEKEAKGERSGGAPGYVAFCQDRHLDPVIEVFYKEQDAIDFAREYMEDHMGTPSAIEEETIKGYNLYLTYLDEGDHAFVKEIEIK